MVRFGMEWRLRVWSRGRNGERWWKNANGRVQSRNVRERREGGCEGCKGGERGRRGRSQGCVMGRRWFVIESDSRPDQENESTRPEGVVESRLEVCFGLSRPVQENVERFC